MMTAAALKALQVLGIAIIVSMIVALLIRLLVRLGARADRTRPAELPTGTVCPIAGGVPEEDVAALSAAIFTMIGPHHILHIGQSHHTWSSDGRTAHHSSHMPTASGRGR